MRILDLHRNLFLILFIMYFAQGVLYAQGSPLSQLMLIGFLGISLIFMLKTFLLKNDKTSFIYLWASLLLLNTFGFIFTGNLSSTSQMNMFKGTLLNSLPFFTTYYLARKGVLKSSHLVWFMVIMIPIVVVRFQLKEAQVMLEKATGGDDIVNNVAYSFVGLIPYVFLIKQRQVLSSLLMLILMYFIISGAKRGAMISGAIGLIMFVYYQLRTVEGKERIRGYIIAFIAVVGLTYFSYHTLQTNEYLLDRLGSIGEKGGSSGRDKIYSDIFEGWLSSSNPLNLLFGYGFAASLGMNRLGLFAHNDWLELLSNFGVLGVSIYFILFCSSISYMRNKRWPTDKKIILFTVVALWFFATLVSMSYTNTTGGLQAIILGYLLGSKSDKVE